MAPEVDISCFAFVIDLKSERLLKLLGVPTNMTSSIDLLLTIFYMDMMIFTSVQVGTMYWLMN